MTTVKLNPDVWFDREYERVKGVLFQSLRSNRNGICSDNLKKALCDAGLNYTDSEFGSFINRLIADGIIEEIGTTAIERMVQPVKNVLVKSEKRIDIPLWILIGVTVLNFVIDIIKLF